MFFILSKIFYFFLNPLVWILILAIWTWRTNEEIKRKKRLWLTVGLLYFFSQSIIISECYRLWNTPMKSQNEIPNYEVGIVLSGMASYVKETKTLHINRSADRIWQALNLYHSKKIKKILLTGGSGYITDKGLNEAAQMKQTLVQWGIPEEDIITESQSRNTAENAIETKKLLKEIGLFPTKNQKALLITSGLHMRRAKAVFDKMEIPVDCYPVDGGNTKVRDYYFYQFVVPNFEYFITWTDLFKEIIGYMAYDIKGYI